MRESEDSQTPLRGLSEEMQMPSRGGGGLSEEMQMPSRGGGGLSEDMQTPLRGRNTEENLVPLKKMSEEMAVNDLVLQETESAISADKNEAPWESYDSIPYKGQARNR